MHPVVIFGLGAGVLAGLGLAGLAAWKVVTQEARAHRLLDRFGESDVDAERLLAWLRVDRHATGALLGMALVLMVGSSWGSYSLGFGDLRLEVHAAAARAGTMESQLRTVTAERLTALPPSASADLRADLAEVGCPLPATAPLTAAQEILDQTPALWDGLPERVQAYYVPPEGAGPHE